MAPRDVLACDAAKPLSDFSELSLRNSGEFAPPSKDTHEHYSRWTSESFVHLCKGCRFPVLEVVDPDDKVGNGFLVVLDASATLP
jgi:hypothetical protein